MLQCLPTWAHTLLCSDNQWGWSKAHIMQARALAVPWEMLHGNGRHPTELLLHFGFCRVRDLCPFAKARITEVGVISRGGKGKLRSHCYMPDWPGQCHTKVTQQPNPGSHHPTYTCNNKLKHVGRHVRNQTEKYIHWVDHSDSRHKSETGQPPFGKSRAGRSNKKANEPGCLEMVLATCCCRIALSQLQCPIF
jgi:hypothetical protein